MLLVIPSLALHNGKCTFFVKGEEGTEQTYIHYSDQPEKLCRLLRRENAKTIHITDLDVLFGGRNESNLEQILSLSKSVDIPIQILSEFNSTEESIKRIQRDDMVALHKKYLDPSRLTILMVGDMTPEAMKDLADKYFGNAFV